MKFQEDSSQQGFTIIELLVSTVAFSLILVGAMAGMVQLGRLYYKGVATAQTQDIARAVTDELTQTIQYSKRTISFPASNPTGPEIANGSAHVGFFCIGPVRYTYAIDRKLSFNPDTTADPNLRKKDKRHVLWVDQPTTGCSDAAVPAVAANLDLENPCQIAAVCDFGRELLSKDMRISRFSITKAAGSELYTVSISIAYGEDNDGTSNRGGSLKTVSGRRVCEGTGFTVQFCAISELSSSAVRRLQ